MRLGKVTESPGSVSEWGTPRGARGDMASWGEWMCAKAQRCGQPVRSQRREASWALGTRREGRRER